MADVLKNFRAKYPGYDDIPDPELARKLAEKYPDSYGDLPDLYPDGNNQKKKDEPGVLDYLIGAGELGLTMATGAIAEPVSGIVGGAVELGLIPGKPGGKDVASVQEGMTYMPKTKTGRAMGSAIGQTIGMVFEPIGKAVQGASDYTAEKAGPLAGTAVKTAFYAIPEILGLKGTKAAKRLALEHITMKYGVNSLYDEAGNLKPLIKDTITSSGLKMDEVEDIIPENIPQKELEKQGVSIGEAANATFGKEKKMRKLAEKVNPNKEILEAADEFGLKDSLLPSHYSENPTYRAVEQGIKSIPASMLDTQEKALILKMADRADNIIESAGGSLSKSNVSEDFISKSKQVLKGLEDSEDHVFSTLKQIIPNNMYVETSNISNWLFDKAEKIGGIKYLSPKEAALLKNLSANTRPTYARLDLYRKQIGAALKDNTGVFKDTFGNSELKQIYKALAEDQKKAAYQVGPETGRLYELGNSLTISRYALQKKLTNIVGKDLSKSVSAEAGRAILDLQKGNVEKFKNLISNIPDEVGPEMRKSIIVSSLNDAFTQGGRESRSLTLVGFDKFMQGLNRNPSAKAMLSKEIGDDTMERLNKFHLVVNGVNRAMKSQIVTGRIMSLPGITDEIESIYKRLYGGIKKVAVAESVTTTVGVPGVGAAGVIGAILSAPKKGARSAAADNLLSSARFRYLVSESVAGKMKNAKRLSEAETAIAKTKEFNDWKKTLSASDQFDLFQVGLIGFLTNRGLEKEGKK